MDVQNGVGVGLAQVDISGQARDQKCHNFVEICYGWPGPLPEFTELRFCVLLDTK